MTRFIAFSGKKQSGKDTSALLVREILVLEANIDAARIHTFPFAKPLKDMIHNIFGISMDLLCGTQEDKENLTHLRWDNLENAIRLKYSLDGPHPCFEDGFIRMPRPRSGFMTVREVLQVIGTDIFRERIYKKVWAEAPFRQGWNSDDIVLIPDARFPDEKHEVEAHAGFMVRLQRNTGLPPDNHSSETSLDNATFDYLYDNNGNLEQLKMFLRATLTAEGILTHE